MLREMDHTSLPLEAQCRATEVELGQRVSRVVSSSSNIPQTAGRPKHTVGFRASQTLERFELWGVCEELNLPSLPTRQSHGLAR